MTTLSKPFLVRRTKKVLPYRSHFLLWDMPSLADSLLSLNQFAQSSTKIFQNSKNRVLGSIDGFIGTNLNQNGAKEIKKMGFYFENHVIALDKETFKKQFPKAKRKVIIFVHGLMGNENDWKAFGKERVSLPRELEKKGITPLLVRYNSGQAIKETSKQLNLLLEKLPQIYPKHIRKLYIVAHSMGGLITLKSLSVGDKPRVLSKLKKVFLLSSPLEGAWLENLASTTSSVLHLFKNNYLFLIAKLLDARSDGIKDLAHQIDLADIDEKTRNKIHLFAGSLGGKVDGWLTKLIGDGLVKPKSSTGENSKNLLQKNQVKIFTNTGHIKIMMDPQVLQEISLHL